MKVKAHFSGDFANGQFAEASRVSTKEIKFSNYGRDNHSTNGKSKGKDKKKDYSQERKQKRGE